MENTEQKEVSLVPPEPKKPKIRTIQKSDRMQRAALWSLLSTEEEYNNLIDFSNYQKDIELGMESEIGRLFNGERLDLKALVLKILQYDVQGYTNIVIARELDLPIERIVSVKTTETYKIAKKELLAAVLESSRKYMEISTVKAVKTLVECMDSRNEKVRMLAAQDLLNRAGLQAPQQIEIKNTTPDFAHLSDSDLEEILKKEKYIPADAEVVSIE